MNAALHETLTVEKISPKKAQQYLNKNATNRSLRSGVVDQYASDMIHGNWTHCVAPIVFYEDGDIADGQHRLWAIIESNVSQQFFVMRGLPRDAGLNIDMGVNRTLVDNARIAGIDNELTYEAIGTARAYVFGARDTTRRSPSQMLQLIEPIREQVLWAIKHAPNGKYLRNSLTRAALARAYTYESDKDRLAQFGPTMTSGFSDSPGDNAAVAFRNHMIAQGPAGSAVGENWRDSFLKAQHAIWNFMRHRDVRRIRTVVNETYPLPKKGKK